MAGLLDFLQAASNAAASNVSGPVDGLAWLLRKAGLDVGEPVGGSDWMKRQGLTRDVPQSGASLAGETVGLLGPLAGAKAPQVAKGLLQAADNLAAPRSLNSQAGAIDVEALKRAFPEVDFWLSQSKDGRATLDRIVVPKEKREQGLGTQFMEALTAAADADSARVGLSPASDFGGSKSRLVEFYKRFGFVPNKGRNRDFQFLESMVRTPKD